MKNIANSSVENYPSSFEIDDAIARARVLRSQAMHQAAVTLAKTVKGLLFASRKKPVTTSDGVIAAI